MTVSATRTGGTPAGCLLQVLVLTGATSTQAGVTAGATNSSGSSAALQVAMTHGAAGNIVFGAAMNWANSTAPTLLAWTVNQSTFSDTVNGDWYSLVKSFGCQDDEFDDCRLLGDANGLADRACGDSSLGGFGVNATLSGSGTLTVTIVPEIGTAAGLSGSGSLGVVAMSAESATAAFSGSGSIGAIRTVAAPAALSGAGSLSAIGAPAAWSGTGTLTASAGGDSDSTEDPDLLCGRDDEKKVSSDPDGVPVGAYWRSGHRGDQSWAVVSGVYDQGDAGATGSDSGSRSDSDSDVDIDSHIAYAIHAGNPAATSVFRWIPHASECRVTERVATDAAGKR